MARSFRQIAIVALLALAPLSVAYGQTDAPVQYRDVLRQCGVDWKASEARKSVEKGQGAKAWQEFRAKCVLEKGWKPGRKAVTTQAWFERKKKRVDTV